MNDQSEYEMNNDHRRAQWQALPSPKMPWETFKRLITMTRFNNVPSEDLPAAALKAWKERLGFGPQGNQSTTGDEAAAREQAGLPVMGDEADPDPSQPSE